MNAKWKRLVTAILMMALLLGPIVSMQTPARAADGEDDNTFIVGFDAEFPPYGYKDDNGEYVGFDLDLAQEVCDRNGWTLKKQPIEWNSKDMELNSGSISCIWNGFTMNGREDDYTWTKPYVDNSQVVVVRKDSGITQLNDLSGKVVAVQADSSALAALTGEDASEENKALCATFKDLQQVGDYNSAFMNLESGAVNAICMDIGVANYEIESRGDKFVMLEDRLSSEEYGIGFKKGNTELRDKVQATLLDMLADGTFDEIAEKWGLEESICLTADDEVQEETKSWTDKIMDLFVDKSKKTVCDSKESLAAYCAAKCTPQFFTGWADGKEDVFIDGQKALLGRCTMSCAYGGEITIQSSGQPE